MSPPDEHPAEGGSYLRQPDGKLERMESTKQSEGRPAPKDEQPQPARKRAKES